MPPSTEERLLEGWEAAATAPDACPDPSGLDALEWRPARVPGTAAGVLRDAGIQAGDLDAQDWWFRTRFEAEGGEAVLELDGIATVAEVFLDGERILESESMFLAHAVGLGLEAGEHELAIRCRALAPLLRPRRKPRARWRTKVVADGNLRFFRTAILGRAPGFAPGPAPVGPYRPVRLRGGRRAEVALRPRLEGDDGVLDVKVSGGEGEVVLSGPSGTHRTALSGGVAALRVPAVARWWPHTHGEPVLHDVEVTIPGATVAARRVGFRTLENRDAEGLALAVNGVPVFARGALWTPVDFVGLAPDADALRAALEQARDGGMNLLRVPGTGAYETPAFHDLCDELGLLVWQDFMFANLDYPIADEGFHALVEAEARQVLAGLAGRPSLAVLCGNSEVEQQVGMLGLDPALGRGELFGELLPALVAASGADAPYLPSAPCGGELPFRSDRGVANYFGVGGYRRPLGDARRAEVRFASECLAFANVPDVAEWPVHDPRWKAGVPRDAGSGWDFDDVRDHYLALLYGVDPGELRRVDHERYLSLSRAVTGEAMAETMGEWRRAGSPCGGALILWLRDLAPGAGWGVVDHDGRPKVAYHHLRRVLAPVAVWTTDEGLNGVAIHVANDGPRALEATLRVALYADLERRVDEATEAVALAPHAAAERSVEGLLGRFVDASWAYRFGPPAQDAIVVSLEHDGDLLSQAVRFPAGRPVAVEAFDRLGLAATLEPAGHDAIVRITTRRLADGVRLLAPGFLAADDAFVVEPGVERAVRLCPATGAAGGPLDEVTLTALNARGSLRIRAGQA